MSDEVETPAVETPLFRTLVPLERYDLEDGKPKVDAQGKRIKLQIPAGTVEERTTESIELVLQGLVAPENEAAKSLCVESGLTDAVISARIAARKKFERALNDGTFAKLEAAQQ